MTKPPSGASNGSQAVAFTAVGEGDDHGKGDDSEVDDGPVDEAGSPTPNVAQNGSSLG